MVIGVNARLLYSKTLEGIPRYIYETTLEMANAHPEDIFILYFDRKPEHQLVFPKNVTQKIVWLPTRHPVLWKLWFDWLLPIHLKKDSIEVFYSGDGYVSLRTDIPQIMVTHDLAYLYFPHQVKSSILRYYRKRIPVFHKKASHIIAVSEFTKNDLQNAFGIEDEKISVAYNAIRPDLDEKKITNSPVIHIIDQSVPYFCYVGAIHPRKNIVTLCKAFLSYKTRTPLDVKLLLAGRMAWMTDDIQKIIQENDDIIYLGSITEEEKKHLLAKSIAMCYVSLFEGFGIPILEGFQANTLVITSKITSMPEVAGSAALLVDPTDEEKIADAMIEAMDPIRREAFILQGNHQVNKFSWKKSGEIIYHHLHKNSKDSPTI